MLDIVIDNDLFDQQADLMGATDLQLENARISALRKMRKTIKSMVLRQVAAEHRIPQKALEGRIFFSSLDGGEEELQTWIGTWNISPFAIGIPRQDQKGVRVGRRSYPGAFLASIYGSSDKVWIRFHSEHYDPGLYPTDYRPGDRGVGGNRGRFPVVRASIPVDGTVKRVMEQNGDYLGRQFEKTFIRELNYQVNVKGSRV